MHTIVVSYHYRQLITRWRGPQFDGSSAATKRMPLIIIAGTPCVGKTTFAKELADALSKSTSSSAESSQDKSVVVINEGS